MVFDDIFSGLFNEKESEDLSKEFAKIVNGVLAESLDIVGGVPIQTETTVNIARRSIKKFTQTKAYRDSLMKFTYDTEKLVSSRIDKYSKEKMYVTRKEINKPLSMAINEYLSTMEEFGLNTQFNQPIRKLILESIRLKKPLSELAKSMNKLILGEKENPGLFTKYAKQNAQAAAIAYSSIVDQKITDKYEDRIKGFMVVGTDIETSTPQCKKCVELGRRISIETMKKVIIPIAMENGFPGTEKDIYKIPTIKLHFGCRREFIPLLTENNLK